MSNVIRDLYCTSTGVPTTIHTYTREERLISRIYRLRKTPSTYTAKTSTETKSLCTRLRAAYLCALITRRRNCVIRRVC